MTLSLPIFQTSLCLCDTFHIVSKLTFTGYKRLSFNFDVSESKMRIWVI